MTSLTIGSIADLDRVVDRGVNIAIVDHIVEHVYVCRPPSADPFFFVYVSSAIIVARGKAVDLVLHTVTQTHRAVVLVKNELD